MRTPFLGPAYVSRSLRLADQQLINLYADVVETKSGKDIGAFYMCPGLDFIANVGAGPIRGARVVSHMNLLFVVSGNQVFAVDNLYRTRLVGTMDSSSGPVAMIDNASQFMITDGEDGWFSDGQTLSKIAFPIDGQIISCAYQDGIGVVNVGGTQIWMASDSFNLNSWNPLSFTSSSAQPDDVVAMADLHREIWVLKEFTSEVWINQPVAGSPFVFQILQGTFIEAGCVAPYSPCRAAESLIWLATNREGQFSVIMTSNYTLQRISTLALEFAMAGYSTVTDAIGWVYSQEGHLFYVLQFPTANVTWCYDITVSKATGTPMWHQRATLANGVFTRHLANTIVDFNGNTIVGDYRNGNLYKFNLDNPTDNGAQRKWLRSWRALPKPPPEVTTYNALQIDMQTGFLNPQTGPIINTVNVGSSATLTLLDGDVISIDGSGNIKDNGSNVPFGNGSSAVGVNIVSDNVIWGQDAVTGLWFAGTAAGFGSSIPAAPQPFLSTNVSQTDNPLVMLRWSDDGGYTWSNYKAVPAGKTGETARRVIFRRMGSTRVTSGLDRIFELSSADNMKVALIGAELS